MTEQALIPIKEYKKRVWGENGLPPTNQAIRNKIKRGELPAQKIGRDWFIDWSLCEFGNDTNSLVRMVLRSSRDGRKTKK